MKPKSSLVLLVALVPLHCSVAIPGFAQSLQFEGQVITPARLGLPAGNVRTSEPVTRVYKADGYGEPLKNQPYGYPFTKPPGYAAKPGEVERKHYGVDVSSRSPGRNSSEPMDYTAGVYGVATRAGGGNFNTITVELADGTRIQYLHSSEVYVKVGDKVTPDTVIAKSGDRGAVPGSVHIHVQARDKNDNILANPDAAFGRGLTSPTAPTPTGAAPNRGNLGGVLINPKPKLEGVEVAGAVEGIGVSLRALRDAVNSSEAKTLFGATRLHGFLLAEDDLGPDCILILERERHRPALRIDDLAIAYRNVVTGQARPACTIDPRPETLKQLADIAAGIGAQQDPRTVERRLREWERIGRGPQDVQVFNIDPQTHFAGVMVEADYDLKTLCNGAAPAAGIIGVTDLLARQVQEDIAQTGTSNVPLGSQNRFWFNPGRVSYRTDGRLFLLSVCEVALLTEEEAVTPEGGRAGKSQPNPLAEQFADDLSRRFEELGRVKPIFRELENLYRVVAVMSLLASQTGSVAQENVVKNALGAVEIPPTPFRKTLPGRVFVKELRGQLAGGTYTLWLPSCGGVSIDITAAGMTREIDKVGDVRVLAKRILQNRPNSRSAAWKFAL